MVSEERVATLESALAHFIEHSDRLVAAIHEDIAEMRACNARTDSRLLEMRQKGEKSSEAFNRRMDEFAQRAEKSNEEFNRRMDGFAQRAEKSNEEFNRRMDGFAQRAEKSNEEFNRRMDEFAQRAEKSNEEFNRRMDEFAQRAEKARQESEKRLEEFSKRTDELAREAKEDHKAFNKRMAEISDSVGTLIEDMVAPCGFQLAEAIFGAEEAETCTIRVKRRHPSIRGEIMEIDLLAIGSTQFLVVEVKRRMDAAKAAEYREKLRRLPEFFPELAGKTLRAAVASVYLEPSVVTFLNREKLYGIAMGDEVMEVVNLGQF